MGGSEFAWKGEGGLFAFLLDFAINRYFPGTFDFHAMPVKWREAQAVLCSHLLHTELRAHLGSASWLEKPK